MALELNGTTGVSLVQDGVVTAADLASGAITSGALPAGSVLQVQSDAWESGNQRSTASTTFVDTELSVTITPASATSKIVLVATLSYQTDKTSAELFRFAADGTGIGTYQFWDSPTTIGQWGCITIQKITTAGTTNPVTYTVQAKSGSGTLYYHHASRANSFTVMEIAG